jgi:hypothetical protein
VEYERKKLFLQKGKKSCGYDASYINHKVPEITVEVGLEIIFGHCNPVFYH